MQCVAPPRDLDNLIFMLMSSLDDQVDPGVIYESNDNSWHCCGGVSNGNPTCSNPTNQTFDAPPPGFLQTYSSSLAPSTTPSRSLSNGAAGGIGAGVTIAVCLIGLAIFFLRRWMRTVRSGNEHVATKDDTSTISSETCEGETSEVQTVNSSRDGVRLLL